MVRHSKGLFFARISRNLKGMKKMQQILEQQILEQQILELFENVNQLTRQQAFMWINGPLPV